MDKDYGDDIAFLANTTTQAQCLLNSLVWAVGSISLHVNADKMEYMSFNQRDDISTLNDGSLKLMDKFIFLRSSSSSMEKDIKANIPGFYYIQWKIIQSKWT